MVFREPLLDTQENHTLVMSVVLMKANLILCVMKSFSATLLIEITWMISSLYPWMHEYVWTW